MVLSGGLRGGLRANSIPQERKSEIVNDSADLTAAMKHPTIAARILVESCSWSSNIFEINSNPFLRWHSAKRKPPISNPKGKYSFIPTARSCGKNPFRRDQLVVSESMGLMNCQNVVVNG